jgi:multiple sugar transport system ATP-binding protein
MGFSLKLAGAPREEIARRVAAAADILDLGHLLERFPKQLSGGQRQRVAMGRAIVRDPQVFLFDEPLSNLDAKLRVQMRAEIKALHQRLKTTTVYVTHDQVEAMTMADKIVVMRDGTVEQVGSPLALYDHPANMFVAGFIGSPAMNFIRGESLAGRFVGGGLDVALPGFADDLDGSDVVLGVRPEHIDLAETGAQAEVVVTEQTGSETNLHLKLAGAQLNVLVKGRVAAGPGDILHIRLHADRLHLFDADTGRRIPTAAGSRPGGGDGGGGLESGAGDESAGRVGNQGRPRRFGATLEAVGLRRDGYRPELHYMRGPGPKTLAKRAQKSC